MSLFCAGIYNELCVYAGQLGNLVLLLVGLHVYLHSSLFPSFYTYIPISHPLSRKQYLHQTQCKNGNQSLNLLNNRKYTILNGSNSTKNEFLF